MNTNFMTKVLTNILIAHILYLRLASYRIMRLNGLMSNAKWWDEAAVGVGL